MKVKFNKYERYAGIFIIVAVMGFLFSLINIAVKQGWFEKKKHFYSQFDTGEGVYPGVLVQISGLRAGAVEAVELSKDNKIIVRFYIFSKYEDKIRTDSVATLIRPFVIGERVLDVSLGSQDQQMLLENSQVRSLESIDILTVMSGRKLGSYLNSFVDMMANLRYLADAFLDKDRTRNMVEMFDRIDPLLKNMNAMSVEVLKLTKGLNKDDRMGTAMAELAITTRQLNGMLPEFTKVAPQMASDMAKLVTNLNQLTDEFKVITPAITAISPELPRVSKRAVEALDEAVVLMKALQRSFIVKGNVQEVRDEEAQRAKERAPAAK